VKLELSGHNYEMTDEARKYLDKKLKKLTKHMNKHLRDSAHFIVKFKEGKSSNPNRFECEIILRLPPREELVAKESTVNMFAAIDIVEAKLDVQLRRYKEKIDNKHIDRKGTFSRLRKVADRDFWSRQN
jgi:putative sigma-54 modulation protein